MKTRPWDTDINCLFGTCDAEDEAPALVCSLLESYGDEYADELAMGRQRPDGSFTDPLTGAALVERVRRVAQEHEPAPESAPTRTGMAGTKRAN